MSIRCLKSDGTAACGFVQHFAAPNTFEQRWRQSFGSRFKAVGSRKIGEFSFATGVGEQSALE